MSKYVNTNKDIAGIENLTRFEGFYKNRYVEPFISGHTFMFMTKPSLFISTVSTGKILDDIAYGNMVKDPYLSQFIKTQALNDNDGIIATQLAFNSHEHLSGQVHAMSYLPIITNRSRSLDIMDISMDSSQSFNTRYGHNMPLPKTSTGSTSAGTVNIGFVETANLDILKTMGVWVRYMDGITDGSFRSNPEMIKKGMLDYMSSIYYFVLEPDGRTLKYWSKFTGVWPISVPYNVFSWNKGNHDVVDVDIPFNYVVKEDMSISILEDFNRVSLNMTDNEWNNYIRTTYFEELESPLRNNRMLLKDELRELIKSKYPGTSNYRQPLVFLDIPEVDVSNQRDPKFRLSFAKEDMGYDYMKELTEETYSFDKEDYVDGLDD